MPTDKEKLPMDQVGRYMLEFSPPGPTVILRPTLAGILQYLVFTTMASTRRCTVYDTQIGTVVNEGTLKEVTGYIKRFIDDGYSQQLVDGGRYRIELPSPMASPVRQPTVSACLAYLVSLAMPTNSFTLHCSVYDDRNYNRRIGTSTLVYGGPIPSAIYHLRQLIAAAADDNLDKEKIQMPTEEEEEEARPTTADGENPSMYKYRIRFSSSTSPTVYKQTLEAVRQHLINMQHPNQSCTVYHDQAGVETKITDEGLIQQVADRIQQFIALAAANKEKKAQMPEDPPTAGVANPSHDRQTADREGRQPIANPADIYLKKVLTQIYDVTGWPDQAVALDLIRVLADWALSAGGRRKKIDWRSALGTTDEHRRSR